jgi:hypothetical protein
MDYLVWLLWRWWYSRVDLETRLRNLEDVRVEHLIRVFFWRDAEPEKKKQWLWSIQASPKKAYRRGGARKVSKRWLLKTLWSDLPKQISIRYIYSITEDVEYTDPELPKRTISNTDYINIMSFCKDYHEWLCGQLAREGWASFTEVNSEIGMLLQQWPFHNIPRE